MSERYRDRDWLRDQYVTQNRTGVEIARKCGCHPNTIYKWLNRHNIETRDGPRVPDERLTDGKWLSEQYLKQKNSVNIIASICGCDAATVCKYLDKHDIMTRSGQNAHHSKVDDRLDDPGWVRQKYIKQKMTLNEIADLCDCSSKTVIDRLKKHGIETRNPHQGNTVLYGEANPNYNGGPRDYGPGWNDRKKRSVRERDDYTCQDARCSVEQSDHLEEYGERLHVHHLRKARDIDDPEKRNDKENLITLCRECHRHWEKIADAGLVPEVKA